MSDSNFPIKISDLQRSYRLPTCRYALIKLLSIDDNSEYKSIHYERKCIEILDNIVIPFSLNHSVPIPEIINRREINNKIDIYKENTITIEVDVILDDFICNKEHWNDKKILIRFVIDKNQLDKHRLTYKKSSGNCCSDYGILINMQSTKIVFVNELSGGYFSSPHNLFTILNKNKYFAKDYLIFDFHDDSVIIPLLSYALNTFTGVDTNDNLIRTNTVLLVGNSGSGLTSLSVGVAKLFQIPFIVISYGYLTASCNNNDDYEQYFFEAFQSCARLAPCVVIIDDIHLMADEDDGYLKKALYEFIKNIKSLHNSNSVFVVATTKYKHHIKDKSILCLFDEKINIRDSFPDGKDKRKITSLLYKELSNNNNNNNNCENNNDIALNSLSDSFQNISLMSFINKMNFELTRFINNIHNNDKNIKNQNFIIAGLANVKQELNEAVMWPRKYTKIYNSYGITSGDVGLLLFGPPGTGKTLIPKVLSSQLGCSLVNMKISDVIRGEIGSSEKNIIQMFSYAKKVAPSIIFIDEFQAIFNSNGDTKAKSESSLSATLALCFDDLDVWNKYVGSESLVTVIAATNEPWAIDDSFLRPGRLGKSIFMGPLDSEGRYEFFLTTAIQQYKNESHNIIISDSDDKLAKELNNHISIEQLVKLTDGYTGADLSVLVLRANYILSHNNNNNNNVRASLEYIIPSFAILVEVISEMKPSTTKEEIDKYIRWYNYKFT